MLTSFQTVKTLPRDYDGENTCAQIWMTPSGRNLYVSNRGHDSIAVFSADRETGYLTFLGAQPTLKVPRAFGIDPSGRYMLVGGLETGELATYRIDAASGQLQHLDTCHIGDEPMWVLFAQLSG